MWLKLVLCFLATYAYADHNPAWRHNYEYVYQVRGHILTSLNQISNNYTGIILKSKLTVRPTSDGHLEAKITDAQYADIHSKLQDAWKEEIPDSELRYEEIPLSSKPFKIMMKNGVVVDIIVDKTIPNWQSNVVKGFVSQLQLDTEAENQIRSSINIFSQEDSETAVFKTMEKTVSGETETLYEIHPFPDYVLQTSPWLSPLNKTGDLIEVVKNKNFTNSRQSPSYHFGFQGVKGFDIDNEIGEFWSRTSMSRAILSGSLKGYTIQSSVTVDQITLNPSLQDNQRGSTESVVNLTLSSMRPVLQGFEEIDNPISVGIIYWYDQPFSESNGPQFRKISPQLRKLSIDDSDNDSSYAKSRPRRDTYSQMSSSESGGTPNVEQNDRVQDQPHMNEPPASPLLPFTVGYDGQAISKQKNIRENVRTLAIQIGQEYLKPERIPEEDTVGKFLLLTSLVKIMNEEDVNYVASQLYKKEEHGVEAVTWFAYRDAVAQAGTGPALLAIFEWIRKEEISGMIAAEVVATAATSARQPTEKYMKVFFEMTQNENIMSQKHLNESLLLSYTTLIHQVYVDQDDSHNKYPVHSFGTFNTEQGRRFVKNTVIPRLTAKLEEAITEADTSRIHAYIRALGNVGTRQILSSFKPYLEGTKKASQFQRILMVIALDNLAKTYPKVARSILFKIYRNPTDNEQLRVAAVYQLLRTDPSPAMLQRMAAYTKIDTSNHVNAAVKSAIEETAKLEGVRFAKIRTAAQSAQPLLTDEDFGVQNSKIFLSDYVAEEMKVDIKQVMSTFGGEDSFLPKGIYYLLRRRFGQVKRDVINLQTVVSSVEDLVNVYEQQTKSYRQSLKEKQASRSVNTKWSSDHTAKLLNIQNEQREQLEAYLFLHVDSAQKIWSFDNNTLENLTDVVRELEQELKTGIHMHYHKMSVHPESALALPTEWGLPFIYTYDRPTLIHIESGVKAEAKPQINSDDGLRKPDTIDVEYQVEGFVSGRIQTQFGLFAPFNHKRYSAGYDKNFQIIVPTLHGTAHIDIENQQLTMETQIQKKSVKFLHFSSWPHTGQNDIHALKPKTAVIRKENPQTINTIFGEKQTGIALSLKLTSDKPIDWGLIYDNLHNKDFMTALAAPWLDSDIQHVSIDLGFVGSRTSTHKVVLQMGQQEKYSPSSDSGNTPKPPNMLPIVAESWERQREFLKNVSKGIEYVYAQAADAILMFEGEGAKKYTMTLARATSNVDPNGRVLVQAEKDNQVDPPSKVSFAFDSKMPNTPNLNVDAALEFDPSTTVQVEGTMQKQNENPSQVSAQIKLAKSEHRKKHLMSHRFYERCKKQMSEGNHQLHPCVVLTAEANLLDQFSVSIDYSNMDSAVINATYKWYSVLRHYLYPRVSEDVTAENPKNRLKIEGQFHPDLSSVNVSIRTEHGTAEIGSVQTTEFARTLFVHHPTYNPRVRLEGLILNYFGYQPTCVIDSNAVNTLDNKTYPATLDKEWVILLHYIPRRPSPIEGKIDLTVVEQLNQQIEGFVAYARASAKSATQKEIKMVIQSPNTNSKVIDVTLKPSDSPSGYARLFIQNEEIKYDKEGTHVYDDYMQVYKLPNNELKVDVYDTVSVVFDGTRAKFSLVNDKFRDAARGLCGTFTGEPETDFTHPGNCIIHDPDVFLATYTVPQKSQIKRMTDMLVISEGEKKCYQKTINYVQIFSAQDLGLRYGGRDVSNMRHRTKYVQTAGKTCFTTNPVPVCKTGYTERSVTRIVPVHCVGSSAVAELMKKQIDQGANPDLTNKRPNKEVMITMAERCE